MKKLVSTVLAASLGFVSIPVSASLPRGSGSAVLFTFSSGVDRVQDLNEMYGILVDGPLDALTRRFTRDYAISFTDGETTQVWIFRDEPQVAAIAERIRAVTDRANDNIATPMLTINGLDSEVLVVLQSLMFGLPQNATTAGTTGPSDDELRREMQEVNAEIEVINKELNKIPAHKPTKNDVKASKCLECKLMDL